MREKILFGWSGGKDSSLALYEIIKNEKYEVVALLTTITEGYDRISMHGVREILLEQQAESIGFPLEKVYISQQSSNEEYQSKMEQVLTKYKKEGILRCAFGDIFLEDVKDYRDRNLSKINMEGIYPIWSRKSDELANTFIELGFKAIITCVDTEQLDKDFVGMDYDKEFLSRLPASADPCGENGEFHSFVYDGPLLKKPVHFSKGEVVIRDNRFAYCDLLPLQESLSF